MIVAKLSNVSDLVSSKSYYTMDEAIHLLLCISNKEKQLHMD